MIETLLFVGALTAGAIGHLLMWRDRRKYGVSPGKRVTDAAWTTAALELGGRLEHDALHGPGRHIEARVAGFDVTLWHSAPEDVAQIPVTFAEVRHTGAVPLELSLVRRDHMRSAVAAFDDATFVTGDERFDHALIARSCDAELARAWLDSEARELVLGDPPFALSVVGDALRAVTLGVLSDGPRLVRLARLLAVVAGGGRRLRARWAAAARELGGTLRTPGDDWAPGANVVIVLDLGRHSACVRTLGKAGVTVELTLTRATTAPLTIVAVSPPVMPTPPLPHGYRVSQGSSEAVAALSPSIGDALATVVPQSVMRSGALVQVTLASIEPDVATWRGALGLAAALADDDSGPYR